MTKQELIEFENSIGDLYLDNKLPFLFHLSGGNEDELIDIFSEITEGDYVLSNHRSHYHALLHGIPPEKLRQDILNGKSMFIYDRKRNFFVSSIIGGTPAIAAGIALGLKKKGSDKRVNCFVGDGTEDSGHLFEAVRYTDGFDLPCCFIIEKNNRSVESTNEERWGGAGDVFWDWTDKVWQYDYEITYPHARKPGQIDFSKTERKTDEEYFPPIKTKKEIEFTDNTEISYRDAVAKSMKDLGEKAVFIGYNVARGDAMGTLREIDAAQKMETPVAENLMVGLGIGLSFEGFYPVVYFERQDFMMVAMDAIVNHVDKIEHISHGEFKVPMLIRAVVADGGPFYSGPTHSQDFTEGLRALLNMPVFDPKNGNEYVNAAKTIVDSGQPGIIVERKSLY